MGAVAEGVKNEAQAAILRGLGCEWRKAVSSGGR